MSSTKGKFIVIEGIDGSGGETQSKKIAKYLRGQKKPVRVLSYPDYRGPIGQLINKYLHKKYNFSKEVQFLLYFSDFLKDKEKINKWLSEGATIIADRYFSSTIAYQCLPKAGSRGLNGVSVDIALAVSKLFTLPRPDLIIYLRVSPEISMARKRKEKGGNLDRHEADKKFLAELAAFYTELAKKQVLAKWVAIDGEKSIEEVFTEIKKLVYNKIP